MLPSIQFVFLDRDGVINRKAPEGQYISHSSQFEMLPGAADAIARLNRAGRTVIVITNQRGVALGKYTEQDLAQMHDTMRALLAEHGARVDAIYYCPHDRNVCPCRKPGTALFTQAFAEFPAANANNSVMVGDSLSDMEAAHRLGMPAYFIRGDSETRKKGWERAEALAKATFDSLSEAVAAIV